VVRDRLKIALIFARTGEQNILVFPPLWIRYLRRGEDEPGATSYFASCLAFLAANCSGMSRGPSANGWCASTIRTCELCLRRAGALRKACADIGALFLGLRHSIPYLGTAKTLIAHHSSRRPQDPCGIFSIDSSNHPSDGGTEKSLGPEDLQHGGCLDSPRVRRRNSSCVFDQRWIWGGLRTSVSAAVGPTFRASWGVPNRFAQVEMAFAPL
jgi:hypothetical protein